MDKARKLIIAGNWKMNLTVSEGLSLVRDLQSELAEVKEIEMVVCPAFTTLSEVSKIIPNGPLYLGAQNMNENDYGAFTGEIAAGMLTDLDVTYVILGHSERRQHQKETDELIGKKAQKAISEGLKPIICVGETLEEREGNKTEEVLRTQVNGCLSGLSGSQMDQVTLAYEPVWAIGTGKTATADQAQEAHAFVRQTVSKLFDSQVAEGLRIQYGGSVKPENARELMGQADVDGALVGGASLKAKAFADIIKQSR